MAMAAECISSCKSNYHTITNTTAHVVFGNTMEYNKYNTVDDTLMVWCCNNNNDNNVCMYLEDTSMIFNRNYSAILATLQITSYALGV